MNTIFEVAKWFLTKESMTQKRLQKLCYYAEAWHYTLTDSKLTGEPFEAWVHGPVSRKIWDKLGSTGMRIIEASQFKEESDITDPDTLEVLELVWNTYKELSGDALEVLTHSETPWKNTFKDDGVNHNVIPYKLMKNYYSSICELDYGE